EQLAAIWQNVLGLDELSVEDSFFDLGGDSIRAVQVLAAGREAGLPLAVWMIYQANSLAELAELIAEAGGDEETGTSVELMPRQLRLLEQGGAGAQRVRLALALQPQAETLEQALQALVSHHDALRLRVSDDGSGHAWIAPAESARLLNVIDLSTVPVAERSAVMAGAAEARYRDLDLEKGPVLGATLFRFGNGQPDELWLAISAVAVDHASWRMLLDDLNAAYEQRANHLPVVLPQGAVAMPSWAGQLVQQASSDEVIDQAGYWLNLMPGAELPLDHVDDEIALTHATDNTVTVALSTALTAELLDGGRAEEALLATLGRTLTEWSGGDRVQIDLVADPRTDPRYGAGIGRLAGPLTESFPLALRIPKGRKLSSLVRGVGQQLRAIPDLGAGYGLLRYLTSDAQLATEMTELAPSPVAFAFSMDEQRPAQQEWAPLAFVPDHVAVTEDPTAPRSHLLDIRAHVSGAQLYLRWTHSTALHDPATVERLAHDHLNLLANLLDGDDEGPSGPEEPDGPRGPEGPLGPEASRRPVRRSRRSESGPSRSSLLEVMATHGIPGAQLAVIRDGVVTTVEGYGHTGSQQRDPVNPDTLFAAGSLSKHVTTFGVLRLVGDGRLDLDEDINRYLTSWRVPGDPDVPVTPRLLLSNLAGLAPYMPPRDFHRGEAVPTVLDLLDGRPPARTPAVRREHLPGEVFRQNPYNYCILQQALVDMFERPFSAVMQDLVFDPLGMTDSSFDPVFPASSGRPFAHAHDASGEPVEGGYHVYPEAAAGGLWSTAGDLGKLAVQLRHCYLGHSDALVSEPLARQMLTPQSGRPYGWSTVIDNTGADLEFGHGGQAFGYQAMSGLRIHSGDGAVVLTNATTGRELVKHLIATVWSNQARLATLWQRAIDEAVAREQQVNGASTKASYES
ncbi:serine hydrolase, partial [Streptomyces sp. NPDC046557]|uniref:serine hydrolase domain-containing protein n=1 Tax=Streptomyces sp. NPDC046557 TaxID=3155372 RepID=UPI0034002782